MRRALLLNTTYEPMNFISDERALRLLLKGRAEIVHGMDGQESVWSDITFSTVNLRMHVPATIRVVGERVKKCWRSPRFRKKILFTRDEWKCAYCETRLTWRNATIDHVLPDTKGSPTRWENSVA